MSRRAIFILYRPKTILNKGKRADHWFWTRYSAYPYLGCQHGCEFYYCRERKFRLTRQMLEVCLELGFPVFILSRSPLVLRDLDLLLAINERARVTVAFSAISAPGAPSYETVCLIERLAPKAEKRFSAMAQIARAGIVTGTCLMPILPGLSDDDASLAAVAQATADHGGRFVLASGLTLADQQRDYFFSVLRERFPDLVTPYQRFYPPGSYSPVRWPWLQIARRIKVLCGEAGISDRMPRPVIPAEKRALNKWVVETLANQAYWMEIEGKPANKVWAYRKAAWAVEDLEQDIGLVYRAMGSRGLASIRDMDPALVEVVEELLHTLA